MEYGTAEDVLNIAYQQKVVGLRDVADRLGVTVGAVRHHARRLSNDGCVELRRVNRANVLVPNETSSGHPCPDISPPLWELADVIRTDATAVSLTESGAPDVLPAGSSEVTTECGVSYSRQSVWRSLDKLADYGVLVKDGGVFQDVCWGRYAQEKVWTDVSYRTQWDTFREKALEDSGRRCERCGSPDGGGLHIHHTEPMVMANTPLREMSASDVEVLCGSCHSSLPFPDA